MNKIISNCYATIITPANLVNELYVTRTEACCSSTVIRDLFIPVIADDVELWRTLTQRSCHKLKTI